MRIGTDMSIAECRFSGYMVMEYNHRELIKKGVLDKTVECGFSVSNPEAWTDVGTPNIHKLDIMWRLSPYDTVYSFNELLEILNEYTERYKSVASCCDWEHCRPNLKNPTPHEMLFLASDMHFSCGLLST